jgi:hypothetical protein
VITEANPVTRTAGVLESLKQADSPFAVEIAVMFRRRTAGPGDAGNLEHGDGADAVRLRERANRGVSTSSLCVASRRSSKRQD